MNNHIFVATSKNLLILTYVPNFILEASNENLFYPVS